MSYHSTTKEAPGARAMQLFQQKKYSDALNEYTQLLPNYSEPGFVFCMISLCLLNMGKASEAESYIMRGIKADPGRSQLYYIAALIRSQLKDPAAAEKYLNEAIKLNDQNADYYALKAEIHLRKKEWAAALGSANCGLVAEPGHTGCSQVEKEALKRSGKRNWFSGPLIPVQYTDPEASAEQCRQGNMFLSAKQNSKAVRAFLKALKHDPENKNASQGLLKSLKARWLVYRLLLPREQHDTMNADSLISRFLIRMNFFCGQVLHK